MIRSLVIGVLLVTVGLVRPASSQWRSIAPMHEARWFQSSALLHDGRMLVAGGRSTTQALASVEIYDPSQDTWTSASPMLVPRFNFLLFTLRDGRVLAIGGLTNFGTSTTSSTEIYDPIADTWRQGPSLQEAREGYAATMLPDGRIVVVGGLDANVPTASAAVDIIDAKATVDSALPNMPIPEYGASVNYYPALNSLIVPTGQFGGTNGYYLRTTQVYSFTSGTWRFGDSLASPHTAGEIEHVTMPDGSIVCPSGRTGQSTLTPTVEVFDPVQLKWNVVGNLNQQRVVARSVVISSDSILVIGGLNGDVNSLQSGQKLSTCEYVDVRTGQSVPAPSMLLPRCYFSSQQVIPSTEIPCQSLSAIYVFGGYTDANAPTAACEMLRIEGNSTLTSVQVDPSLIVVPGSSCQAVDSNVEISNFTCDGVTLDSMVTQPPGAVQLVGNYLPSTLAKGGVLRLQLLIAPTVNSIDLTLYLHSASGHDTRKVRIATIATRGHSLQGLGDVVMRQSLCNARDTTLRISGQPCQTISIDSVVLFGPDASAFALNGKLPTLGAPIVLSDSQSINLQLVCNSSRVGQLNAFVRVYGHTSTGVIDSTSSITWIVISGNPIYTQAVISDRDFDDSAIFTEPLTLLDNSGIAIDGIRITFAFNTDLLEMLDPDLNGTLESSSAIFDLQRLPTGASLYLPATFATSSARPLVGLRFKSFVTDTLCTMLRITGIETSTNGSQIGSCLLAVAFDSALLCQTPQCGDRLMGEAMKAQSANISLSIDQAQSRLVLRSTNAAFVPTRLCDILGSELPVHFLQQNSEHCVVDISRLATGVYILSEDAEGQHRSQRFSITR